MKKVFLLATLLLLLMLPALAEQSSDLDGTWVYSEVYDQYKMEDGELSIFQKSYPNAQLELRIAGNEVRIRAHMPYVSWFHLELDEETGWFERTGTLEGNLLTVESTYTARTYNRSDYTVSLSDKTETARFTLSVEDGKLLLSEQKTGANQLKMIFEKSDTGLTFDVADLQGTWDNTRFVDVGAGRTADTKAIDYFDLTDTFLVIDNNRVTVSCINEREKTFVENGKYALDANEVTVKEGGLFINLRGMNMKLFRDHTGTLRVVPLFNESMKTAMVEQNQTDLTGQETMDFIPLWADLFSENPSMPSGALYLNWYSVIAENDATREKVEKDMEAFAQSFGLISITDNIVTIDADGKEFSGPLTFPDLYNTADKEAHAFFTFTHNSYTFVLNIGDSSRNVLLLNVYLKNERVAYLDFYPLAGEGGIAGEYCCFSYWWNDEYVASYSSLTIDEQGNITQLFQGKTDTGKLHGMSQVTLNDIPFELGSTTDNSHRIQAYYSDGGYSEIEYCRYVMSEDVSAILHAAGTSHYDRGGSSTITDNMLQPEFLAISEDKSCIVYGTMENYIYSGYILPVLRVENDVLYVEIDGAEASITYPDPLNTQYPYLELRHNKITYYFSGE